MNQLNTQKIHIPTSHVGPLNPVVEQSQEKLPVPNLLHLPSCLHGTDLHGSTIYYNILSYYSRLHGQIAIQSSNRKILTMLTVLPTVPSCSTVTNPPSFYIFCTYAIVQTRIGMTWIITFVSSRSVLCQLMLTDIPFFTRSWNTRVQRQLIFYRDVVFEYAMTSIQNYLKDR